MYYPVSHTFCLVHQYIKILTCVSVSGGSGMFVGRDYSDARPSYFNLFTEPRIPRRMFENIGGWNPVFNRGAAVEEDAIRRAAVEADAIGEQQLKRTQSGSSSRSGRDREQQLEAEANGEQQWKRMPQSGPGAAAEADAIGEKQLFRELSGAGLRMVGEQGGSS